MSAAAGILAPLSRREGLVIAALALLAFGLRLAHVLAMRASPGFEAPIMDALYHAEWAAAWARGEDFQEGPFFRAPLYPWFLGLVLKLAGPGLLVPRLVQCAFGAAAAALAYLVGRRAFDRPTALLAGLVAATYWVLVYFDGELLIETLVVPLDLLALYLTLGLAGEARPRRALAAGLVWGVSAIARPNVLLLMPFLALWLLVRQRRSGLASGALLALGVLLPIAPITAYNRIVGGEWVLISTQGGVNFWIGNNPHSDGSTAIVPGTRGGWWEGYHDAISQAEVAEGRELGAAEVSRHYARRAWRWMAEHPLDAFRHMAWKLRLFWIDWELGNNLEVHFFAHRFDPLMHFLPLGFAPLAGLGLVGLALVLLRREARSRLFPLWGFVVVYMVSVVAFFVCSRFRVPVLAPLAILGAHALLEALRAVRAGRIPRAALILGAAALLALGSHLRPRAIKTGEGNGYWQLGVLAMGAGDLRAAEGYLRYATQLDPGNLFARVSLARLLILRGEHGQADGELRAALALDPERVDTLDARFELQIARGEHDALEQSARALAARSPHLASPHFHLARVRIAQGRMDEALAELRTALERDPSHFTANLLLARIALAESGADLEEEALAALERAVARAAGEPAQFAREARAELAELYERRGEVELAARLRAAARE